ncbi:2-hydroxymuconate tautomerase [Azotobacter beijerinckii]|uniref:2-hydroxymuconate tautomerase n=1 Tax=Azotobacter beijerinckii TaxID=170623 RepID=UPI0029556805|nr:2-hydroxymuconate tautomerase [Azotobacter beijerinckii]MDV7210893.1 2-hydroxymuconate tautomerase [Azotobacter beijerinckii]
MPIVHVHVIEGPTREQKETMIREVSQAISRSLDSPLERIRIIIHEIPKTDFGIAGEPVSKLRP